MDLSLVSVKTSAKAVPGTWETCFLIRIQAGAIFAGDLLDGDHDLTGEITGLEGAGTGMEPDC